MKLYRSIFLLLSLPVLVFPRITVVEQSPSGVVIEFQMEDLRESITEINGVRYYLHQFPDGVSEEDFGNPAVPHLQMRLAVPYDVKISYQLISLQKESRQNALPLPQGFLDFPEKNITMINRVIAMRRVFMVLSIY